MDRTDEIATCHWLTPTRLMPHPYGYESHERPWTCLRDGYPRPLDMSEFHQCAACARWEPRTFDDERRDLVFEAWGGVSVPEHRSFDEARRDLVLEAWGVEEGAPVHEHS